MVARNLNSETAEMLRNASQLFRAGRVGEGIAAYQALLAREPDLPDSWFNLAMLLRQARRYDDALAAYRSALDHGLSGPEEAHLRRAVIYSDHLGRSDDAHVELKTALQLNPDYVPAWLNLGNLHEDRGDWDAARDAYARALQLAPQDALALARLVGLPGASPETIQHARDRLRSSVLAPEDRADLGYTVGAVLDRAGDYDAAFEAYAQANRASRDVAVAAGWRYDAAAQSSFVDHLIDAFPAPVSVRSAGAAPIFISGMFRSGSTLAEQVLARHSHVVAGGELDALPALIRAKLQPYPSAARDASSEIYEEMSNAYLAETGKLHSPGTLLTDKRPDNFLHVGVIKAMFPAARIIHTVRRPLDNILSVYFLHAGPQLAYATDLTDIAHFLGEQQRLMAHWRSLWPNDILELDYDRLVAEPRPSIARLLDFCGLEWEERVLDHRQGAQAVRTASNWQVRQPLYRGSSGRWTNYARHLTGLTSLIAQETEEHR